MDIESIIGSRGVRCTTVVGALLFATAVVFRVYAVAPWAEGTLFLVLSIVLGAITFIGLIHSFRALYSRWLAFAGFLQGIVVAVLFGGSYLLIVPWFALVAHLVNRRRSRGGLGPGSLWVPKSHTAYDESYFERMG